MQDPTELKRQSARLRQVLLRILEPLFILVASLLLLILIPYFPHSLSVILSIVIAAIAFKARSVALLLMFALSMPGYIYQGGFPPLMLGIVSGTLFIVAITCIGAPGTALGVATGAIAAMVMFTPLYFLAIPLLIGVALFRAKGIKVGVAEAILVFLAFYLPFLVPWHQMLDPSQGVAPLFGRVDFTALSTPSVMELSQSYDHFKDSLSSNPYIIDNMAVYWPTGGSGRLLGFILLFTLVGAIMIAFGALSIVDWFRQRIEERKYINWLAPTFALLIANMAFLIPVFMLRSAFEYEVGLGAAGIFGFLVATIAIGNAGSAVEYWLGRHERLIELRFGLEKLMAEIGETEARLTEHISVVKEACPNIDLFSERFKGERCRQELSFISANIDAMDSATMSDKLELLRRLKKEVADASRQVSAKLLVYIDDSRHEYRQLLTQAADFGFSFDEESLKGPVSRHKFADDDTALAEQKALNWKYKQMAEVLVSSGGEISRTIKAEVDSEFIGVSMDIAQNLYDSGNYREAIEAALSAMSTAERMIQTATSDLAATLNETIKRLQETIKNNIIPAIESTNDPALVRGLYAEFVKLERMRFPARPGRKLVDRLQVIKASRELYDWTNSVIEQLLAKINALEDEIDSMVPPGYSWGKREFIPPQRTDIVDSRHGKQAQTTVEATMDAIKEAIHTIEEEAGIIRHYMSVREFVINYPNIEYLLDEKLRMNGYAALEEVPVKPNYAMRYLQLYSQKHYRSVAFDTRAGKLEYRSE
ncbi:MAG: hypothetical protein R6U89_05030 [Dehalococcoidia bacterium]